MPSTTRSSISREIAVEELFGSGAIDGCNTHGPAALLASKAAFRRSEIFFRIPSTSDALRTLLAAKYRPYSTATEGCSLILRYITGCVLSGLLSARFAGDVLPARTGVGGAAWLALAALDPALATRETHARLCS